MSPKEQFLWESNKSPGKPQDIYAVHNWYVGTWWYLGCYVDVYRDHISETLSDGRWEAVTIELLRLRRQGKT